MIYGSLNDLKAAVGDPSNDWVQVRDTFAAHVRTGFLEGFLRAELTATAADPEHIIQHAVAQNSYTFINTTDYEYSVRVVPLLSERARQSVKWAGMLQALAVRGPGSLVVRTLVPPEDCDFALFRKGVRLHQVAEVELTRGELFASTDVRQVVQIKASGRPVVLQALTRKSSASDIVWTFGPDLDAVYCEQSSIEASRFRNILCIAQSAGVEVPADIYDLALSSQSTSVVLLAIQSMIETQNDAAFLALQRASESTNVGLKTSVNAILDTLFEEGGK